MMSKSPMADPLMKFHYLLRKYVEKLGIIVFLKTYRPHHDCLDLTSFQCEIFADHYVIWILNKQEYFDGQNVSLTEL